MIMDKRLIICLLFFFTLAGIQAQTLEIKGVSPGLYLTHTVQPKENWYSVGRIFNQSPKDIAPFNGTTMDKPLAIGQTLKIPLNTANFSQDGLKASDESLVPIYHTVADKEWMYRISTNYNKVPVELLEQWNHINKDQVKSGMRLIVGYLKVKTAQSALAASATTPPISTVPVATNEVKKEVAKVNPPQETKTVVEDKKTIPVSEKKPAVIEPVSPVTPAPKPKVEVQPQLVDFKEGYFKNEFESAAKTINGSAHIFRSTSGFSDGKYYALMNNVPVGTIAKITANGKTIFAKVLGNLTDIKENTGLIIRISNAGAAVLGVGENKFIAEVSY